MYGFYPEYIPICMFGPIISIYITQIILLRFNIYISYTLSSILIFCSTIIALSYCSNDIFANTFISLVITLLMNDNFY